MFPRCELLRWQFELTWSLFDYHLVRLEAEDFLWEPVSHCWTVRPAAGGTWVPDWAETEPDPVPVPTIGWVSWHIGWWWSVTVDHARGRAPRERAEILWPGEGQATVEWLRGLREDWGWQCWTGSRMPKSIPSGSPTTSSTAGSSGS